MRKQEELVKSIDVAIEDGYLKAPEIVALGEVSHRERHRIAETTVDG